MIRATLAPLVVGLLALAAPASAQGIGVATARVGLSRDADGGLGNGSIAAEARFAFQAGRFELGPKVGYARLGGEAWVWEPGVLARHRFGAGPWRPTVHGALSGLIYSTLKDSPVSAAGFRDVDGYFGGEVGVGILRSRSQGPDIGVEIAVHQILQNTAGFEPGPYWTITVGVETSW